MRYHACNSGKLTTLSDESCVEFSLDSNSEFGERQHRILATVGKVEIVFFHSFFPYLFVLCFVCTYFCSVVLMLCCCSMECSGHPLK